MKVLFWVFRWIYSKILAFVYGGAPRSVPTIKNSILMESATSLAGRIRSRNVTSVDAVRSYIHRMQEVNGVLNCLVDERFEEALAEAEKADELIKSGLKTEEELERETPFLGVPFTVPDSVAVKGLANTMGTPSRMEVKADEDSSVVRLMREGGAIPVACTNVAEGCVAWETNNPLFGRTCNPYDTNRTVGRPFGGEACLIASSGSPLGVAPSVGLASAFNGVFGHKPSSNLCPGPMSRSSADLLPALKLLAKDSKTDLRLDEPVELKGLKCCYMTGDGGGWYTAPVNAEIKEAVERAVDHLGKSHGASVKRVDLKRMGKAFSIWMAKATETCTKRKINLRKELIKALFGKSHHTLAFLFAAVTEQQMQSPQVSSKQIEEDYDHLRGEFEALLGSNGVFIYPSQPTTAHRHNESLTKSANYGYVGVFEVLGFPTTYCPAGLDAEGLPMGLQIVAGVNQDRLTMAVAREMEKVFGGWKPPPTRGTFTLKNSVFHDFHDEKLKTL